jgi:type I restriction enzyme S subunit
MSEWKEYKLGDIATFSYGKMPKSSFIGKGDFCLYTGYKYTDKYPFCSCNIGDVILVARGVGGTGDVKLVTKDCYLTNLSIKIDLNNHIIDNKFFYYLHQIENLRYLDSGSAQSQITINDLSNVILFLPPLTEQKRIVSILGSLDDKIDLLHRENETLEAMAETLFRKWFIEDAKDEWKEGKLGDEFNFIMGQSPKGESFNEEEKGIPMYQGNADFGFRFPTRRIFTTEPTRIAEEKDTLISVRAPVGAQNMAIEKCCIGRGLAAFKYKKDNLAYYSYTYYKLKSLLDEIKQFNDNGTVFGSISKSDFNNLDIIIPDLDIIIKFQNIVKPIDDKIINNDREIKNLIKLRNGLLSKLILNNL